MGPEETPQLPHESQVIGFSQLTLLHVAKISVH